MVLGCRVGWGMYIGDRLLCRSYVTAGNRAVAAAQDFSRAGAGAGGAGGGLGGIGYNAMPSVLWAAGPGREVGLCLIKI